MPPPRSRAPWWWRKLWQRARFAVTGRFLCDECRFDYRGACVESARPNAKTCPRYQRGGH